MYMKVTLVYKRKLFHLVSPKGWNIVYYKSTNTCFSLVTLASKSPLHHKYSEMDMS